MSTKSETQTVLGFDVMVGKGVLTPGAPSSGPPGPITYDGTVTSLINLEATKVATAIVPHRLFQTAAIRAATEPILVYVQLMGQEAWFVWGEEIDEGVC